MPQPFSKGGTSIIFEIGGTSMGIVAAAQVASVYFDAMATAHRVVERIAEAAKANAWLVVFPESCIPGYPDWIWHVPPHSSSPSAKPFSTFERRFFR